jgi:transcriptional regulator with XRE-family HTH domain
MLVMNPPVSFQPGDLGAELVRLRTDAHLSQRALSRLAEVSNTTISALEQGDGAPPHPTMLAQLARGLATSGLGTVDEDRVDEAYRRLMRAAGYTPDVPAPDDDALLRKLIERRLGNRANTELVESILDSIRGQPTIDQQTVLSVVGVLVRSLPRPGES